MKLMILGATGLVGGHVLQQALLNPQVTEVIAPVRQALSQQMSTKLQAPVINFNDLASLVHTHQPDAIICALGTTIKKAQSKAAFKQVDFSYPIHAARAAKEVGTACFVLNSAMGANPKSRVFYNQVKGELENALKDLEFISLVIAQPGLIGGKREEFRLGEEVGLAVLRVLGPVLPKKLRINPAERIAHVMLQAAIDQQPGIHYISSAELN